MNDNETNESILSEESSSNESIVDIYKDFPKCSNLFLKKLKETFDIRKMCRYTDKVEYLRGIQDVLDFIEQAQKSDKD
nr:MAG TPA: hypothetical protein [Caudoviricetes sp.]